MKYSFVPVFEGDTMSNSEPFKCKKRITRKQTEQQNLRASFHQRFRGGEHLSCITAESLQQGVRLTALWTSSSEPPCKSVSGCQTDGSERTDDRVHYSQAASDKYKEERELEIKEGMFDVDMTVR